MVDLWHAYNAVDGEEYIFAVLGPIAEGTPRSDGQKWEDPYLMEGPNSGAMNLDFITSFDHEPSSSERLHLVPEEYRDKYVEDLQTEVAVLSASFSSTTEFSEHELMALSLAIMFRVGQLQETVDHYIIAGSLSGNNDRAHVKGANDQIEALLSIADKLELNTVEWEV